MVVGKTKTDVNDGCEETTDDLNETRSNRQFGALWSSLGIIQLSAPDLFQVEKKKNKCICKYRLLLL